MLQPDLLPGPETCAAVCQRARDAGAESDILVTLGSAGCMEVREEAGLPNKALNWDTCACHDIRCNSGVDWERPFDL
ncbi:hypothetical protein EYF80_010934 [Liparis tanakae]|uniref:Uncharacterized protein n=1 Tax=Liparis tanakae TaxID=230148 RepID=A0A4Z2IMQ2_9TELE|nr:hypothetical protein EYF80_010934 [Liparis tanakae]